MRTQAVSLVPIPSKLAWRDGLFTLSATTSIEAPEPLRAVAELLRDRLRPATGLPLPIVAHATGTSVGLALDAASAALGDEGYRLSVAPSGVAIRAPGEAGLRHGVQTLLQLLPPAIFRRALTPDVRWEIPAVDIEDRPRFAWRGSHLDVARHFMPKDFVLKHLDLLALHKLNVFHWHLTDDQGWRIAIEAHPKLTEVGAWRKDSMVAPRETDPARRRFSGRPHGGFYTKDDVREVVRYAADRGITVVPEIEMPGHALAAIAAYPELGNTGARFDVQTHWGICEHVMGVGENVFAFVESVLDEVLALFPSTYVHVGGDEVPKREWKESRAAQARMKELGLSDEEQLQSWFVTRIDAWLAARGRRLVGWDEILEGGLAPGATVMSWRGEAGGVVAAKAGHDVVMAPEQPTYFDHDQSADEPLAIRGLNSLADVYAYEPVPRGLDAAEAKHVLGAQGQLWTEYMPDPRRVEYMAWPRLAALAEVLWSPRERRDFADFTARIDAHLERLTVLDVNYYRARRPSG
ncbi:MAG TPA: beta-N-acetylhexosaminidase [Candidatus Limnocylindria bacterium]|nr:beta-N-acetylhexosaminidase [Candidatus Limnocylindria bacterium]